MKIILYPHGGSGNHGCEAIVRSTAKLLKLDSISLYTTQMQQDLQVGLHKICNIKNAEKVIQRGSIDHILAIVKSKILGDKEAYDKAVFSHIIKDAKNAQYFLSIGGDNYCYGANNYIYLVNKMIDKAGVKRILWGASVEPTALEGQLLEDLRGFHKIWARESLTYEALLEKGLKQSFLLPDPAFILDRKDLPLPGGFLEGNTVGINVSPMVISYEKNKGTTLDNYISLIQYIIECTDMQVALIPHVVWPHNDDRLPLNILFNKFKESGRVCMIEDHNAEELKGYIARCRFMVVARTHASIAAYSTQVPTLVVGYSVKARGIAKDIFGTEENYVIPVQSLQKENDLKNAFSWIMNHEEKIRKHLAEFMPKYISRLNAFSLE